MICCREVAAKTSDYINKDVSWREWVEIRAHLLMCRLCRRYVLQMAGTVRLLRRLRFADSSTHDDAATMSTSAARQLFRSSRRPPPTAHDE